MLLATAVFKPQAALSNDGSYSSPECKISHVYTSRDKSFGSFMKKPVRGVKGFAREFPPKSGYAFKHSNRGLGVGRVEPDRSGCRDVLVAYVLPKDARHLAVVAPVYHFDFKAFAADAKKQEADEAAFDARNERAAYAYDYERRNASDYHRSQMAIRHSLGTLGIPIIVPTTLHEVKEAINGNTLSVGGDAQADDVAVRVKRVLEACVPAAAAASPAPAGKGKRQAVPGVGVENLPVPFLMHTSEAYTRTPQFRVESTALEDTRSRRKNAPDRNARWSFAEKPRSVIGRDLVNSTWGGTGYLVHGVTAVFDLASMAEAALEAVKRDSDLLPGGAEKHPSAVADDASLPELYRRQSLEDLALARSQRIVEELMRASMSFHVEVKPLDWDRNPASRNPSRLRWKPFQPLARTATSVRA